MSSGKNLGRHRAGPVRTNPLSTISKSVSENAGGIGRQAAVIAAATGLVLTSGIAANAAETNFQPDSASTSTLEVQSAAPATIAAATDAPITFERVDVSSTAAPVEAPKPVVKARAQTAIPAAPRAQTAIPAAAPAKTAVGAAAPAKVGSGVGATILAAAYAQLGVKQDCTALVSNSLAAAGINFHSAPAGYLSLGRTVSAAEAQPGDLMYYTNGGAGVPHIAVYAGNGQGVHGGFNGNTVLFSAYVGSGPVFIAMGH